MSPTYQQNKKHIYKWRAKNMNIHRANNVKYKRWKTIQLIFLNILL